MKIKCIIKDPDVLTDAIQDAVLNWEVPGLIKDELDAVREKRAEKIGNEISEKWCPYGEYYGIEFDTDAGTARVLTREEQG